MYEDKMSIGRKIALIIFVIAIISCVGIGIFYINNEKKKEVARQEKAKQEQQLDETYKNTKDWGENVQDENIEAKVCEFFNEKFNYYFNFNKDNVEEKKKQIKADKEAGIITEDLYKWYIDLYNSGDSWSVSNFDIKEIGKTNKRPNSYNVWFNADFNITKSNGENTTDLAEPFNDQPCALGIVNVLDDGTLCLYSPICRYVGK